MLSACTPDIGDDCVLSTDCSSRGDRLCDTSQPGGYCTQASCGPNSCPEEGSCVEFYSSVPGCARNDRIVSRVARTFCMYVCGDDGDCRTGYVCRHPSDAPWLGRVVDDDRSRMVCLVAPKMSVAPPVPAPVCSMGPVDAGFPPPPPLTDAGDASISDAGVDAPSDGAIDQ